MPDSTQDSSLDVAHLILGPAVLTLLITIFRLIGELAHWSPRLFNAAPGGGGAIIGISWLPFILGPYFAVKLVHSGHTAHSLAKTFGLSVLGIILMAAGGFIGFGGKVNFPGKEIVGILLIIVAPILITLGWPALFRVLVAYGYAARIPVAILMFFAIRGHWGTHYDVVPPTYTGPTSLFGEYMLIGFLPQMVVWIAFTVLIGTFVGSIAAAMVHHNKTAPAAS